MSTEQLEDLRHFARRIHATAKAKGWWDGLGDMPDWVGSHVTVAKLALVVTEIAEAIEAVRKPGPDRHLPDRGSLEVELADAMIRILDLGEALGIDVVGAMVDKAAVNDGRTHRHGGKRL